MTSDDTFLRSQNVFASIMHFLKNHEDIRVF